MTQQNTQQHKLAHSIDGATKFLPFGKSTIRKFVNSGQLKSFRVGNLRLIGHDTLVQFVQELESAGFTPTPKSKQKHTAEAKGEAA